MCEQNAWMLEQNEQNAWIHSLWDRGDAQAHIWLAPYDQLTDSHPNKLLPKPE